MEYKLKKSEFYRIAYLVAGLLMFLFLFGIFNLSSYAVSPSTRSLSLAPSESYSETYGSYFYTYDPSDYDMPITTITTSTGGSGYSSINYTGTVRGSNTVHLVTSVGDYVVNINQGLTDPQSRTVSVLGVPQRAYAVFDAYNNQSSAVSTYATFTVNSISVSNAGGNGLNASNYSDYSSYSPVNSLTGGTCDSAFYSASYNAGDPLLFSFSDLNTSNLTFNPSYMNIPLSRHNDIMCVFTFSCTSSSNPISSFVGYFGYDNSAHPFYLSDLDILLYNVSGSIYRYLCIYRTSFDLSSDFGVGNFIITGSTSSSISDFSFSLLSHKYTIADYMDYVQQNWDNISPTVTNTDANTSQSVSTVGSASSYESSQFANFDNLVTQTGVDSFSLSSVSVPLLWVGGLITSCYNALPSSIQYLLMFVGVFGLICMILNVFGRVTSRIGESDSTKLNKHDVFSKIEKNGSI